MRSVRPQRLMRIHLAPDAGTQIQHTDLGFSDRHSSSVTNPPSRYLPHLRHTGHCPFGRRAKPAKDFCSSRQNINSRFILDLRPPRHSLVIFLNVVLHSQPELNTNICPLVVGIMIGSNGRQSASNRRSTKMILTCSTRPFTGSE